MDKTGKILSLCGLAQRGRNLISGEDQVLNAIRDGEAMLVIVAADSSENTKKLYTDKCSYYGVPLKIWGDRNSMGHALGKENRAAVAVLEPGFAEKLKNLLED